MTVSSAYQPDISDGDGISVAFPVTFRFDNTADVRCLIYAVDGTPRTPAFTVTGTGDPGGTVTITDDVPQVGEEIVITRETALLQKVNYEAGDFPSASHERAADRLTMAAQERAAIAGRTLRLDARAEAIDAISTVAVGQTLIRTAEGFGPGPTAPEVAAAQANAELAVASRDAAAASAAAADGDATATAADRVQTGLDRTATGEDATATAADRVLTGLDRTATGEDAALAVAAANAAGSSAASADADAAATAADRVQTGLDRTATGEDAAAAAASAAAAAAFDPALYALLDSPVLINIPTAPTAPQGTSTDQIATTQFHNENTALTKAYESTGQTITTAGLLTLAHGLGEEPKLVELILQCTTADGGYAVGDRIIASTVNSTSSGRLSTILLDASNISIRFSNDATSVFAAANKATGAVFAINAARWQLYVRAFA